MVRFVQYPSGEKVLCLNIMLHTSYCQVFFIILEKRGIWLEEGDFSVFLVSKTS